MKHVVTTALIAILFAACSKSTPAVKPDPEPKPTGALACEAKIALVCAEGEADGCADGRTLFHACVPAGETAGPPCEQEIAKVCPAGQVDACLATPVLAATHLCVVTAAAAPVASACPEGQAFFAPGCGSEDTKLDAEGCYASCAAGAACAAGFTCKTVTTDPCHDSMCDACGSESQLCIPSA